MSTYKDLLAFKKAFALAMKIFETSKRFPKEEIYSLTDQVRRSSRSVCTNFAEAFRRRKYPAHFLSKLSDSDAEHAETDVWLDFAFSCQYITETEHRELKTDHAEVGRLIGDIIKNPQKYK
jgi:four helix bundle protein